MYCADGGAFFSANSTVYQKNFPPNLAIDAAAFGAVLLSMLCHAKMAPSNSLGTIIKWIVMDTTFTILCLTVSFLQPNVTSGTCFAAYF